MPAGTTSATITQRTTIDTLFNGVNALSMTTFAPIPSLVDTIAPSSTQHVGDELTYRLELTLDAAGDSATDVVITDVIPPEGSYVPGSATIAAGWNSGADDGCRGRRPGRDRREHPHVACRLGSERRQRRKPRARRRHPGADVPRAAGQRGGERCGDRRCDGDDDGRLQSAARLHGDRERIDGPAHSARRPIADSANLDGGRHRPAAGDVDRPRRRVGHTPRRWHPDELAHDPRRGQLSARPGDGDRDVHPRARFRGSGDPDRLPGDRRVRAERGLDLHPDGHPAAATGATRPDQLWAARHLPDGHGPDPERRLCRAAGRRSRR